MIDRAYRYLDSEWGPRFWNLGLIGISTTRSVAEIEGRQRDERDAAVELRFQHHFRGAVDAEPEMLAAASRVGIHMEGCTDVRIENAVHVIQQPGYMFCMSARPDCHAFPGKEWVFEITSLGAFSRELFRAADGRLPLFCAASPVHYLPRTYDARDAAGIFPDPFVKEAGRGYEEEEEVRLFWPTIQPPPSRLSLLCRPAMRFVRLVSRP